MLVGVLLSSACGGDLTISVTPSEVHFGEVDFRDWPTDMEPSGYDATSIEVTNDGERSVILTLTQADFDRLCLLGISEEMVPHTYPALEPGRSLLVQVGVCAYMAEDGDRDTLIEGEIVLQSDKPSGEVSIPWSFTPTIELGSDTGS